MKHLLVFFSALLFLQCATFRERPPSLPQADIRIAVLPFTARGPGLSERAGHVAADRLTTYLYVDKHLPVIDRSRVSYALSELKVENVYYLSQQVLTQIAKKLDATVIVLGMLESQSRQQRLDKLKYKTTITLRFLDGESGDVSKIIYDTMDAHQAPEQLLDEMLTRLVKAL